MVGVVATFSTTETVIVSFLRADLGVLSVLNDSSIRVYSPVATPVVSMSKSVESECSSNETKERDVDWRRLIASCVPIGNSEKMCGILRV